MKCHSVQRLLPDYIGDELSFKKKGRVEQHLEECPHCRADLAALQGVWDGLAHQSLPQRGEEFWPSFTARVMKEVRRKRPAPAEKKTPLLLPHWKVLLAGAGTAAAVIAAVITLKGVLGPGPGTRTAQDAQETFVEVDQPFSVAPLPSDDEYPFGNGISLNGRPGSSEGEGIVFTQNEMATLAEALTQLTDDEGLSGQLESLDEGELERFDQLLSTRYPQG
jgi:hypothetical protein